MRRRVWGGGCEEVDVWKRVWEIGFWEEGVGRMMCGGGVCGGTYCRYVEVWCGRHEEDCVLYLHKAL